MRKRRKKKRRECSNEEVDLRAWLRHVLSISSLVLVLRYQLEGLGRGWVLHLILAFNRIFIEGNMIVVIGSR